MFGSRETIVNRSRRWQLTAPRALSRLLAATLFPSRCCLCGFAGESLDLDLCPVCRADLPWADPAPTVLAALRFEHPVDDLVRRLKYQGVLAHARVLGVLLAQAVRERGAPRPQWLVPVPLSNARWRERGFNQATCIARYAGRLLEIPVAAHAVHRARHTSSQTSLDIAARRHNVRGAFAPGSRRQLARLVDSGHVAVVDDVVTTGSTMNEVRQTLLACGVSRVEAWAAARAE